MQFYYSISQNIYVVVFYIFKIFMEIFRFCNVQGVVILFCYFIDVNDVIYVEFFIFFVVYVECSDFVDIEGKFLFVFNECYIVLFVIIQVFIWG